MTRKRFVKLVMSHGHDRNYANYVADTAVYKYRSYGIAYSKLYNVLISKSFADFVYSSMDALSIFITKFVDSLSTLLSATRDASVAFVNTFAESMNNQASKN